jgi:phosphatidate cytidylyltransferase
VQTELKTRIVTAIALLIPTAAIIFYGSTPLLVLTVLLYAMINLEFFRVCFTDRKSQIALGCAINAIIPALYLARGLGGLLLGLFVATSLHIIVLLLRARTNALDFNELSGALLAAIYAGLLPALLIASVDQTGGGKRVLGILLLVIASDSCAYFGGRYTKLFQGALLAPALSPKKTFAGSFWGIAGTIFVSILLCQLEIFPLSLMQSVVFGFTISLMAQAGDLFESLIKRLYKVKDFGNILPGHGGILDRVDALLFVAPALLIFS